MVPLVEQDKSNITPTIKKKIMAKGLKLLTINKILSLGLISSKYL